MQHNDDEDNECIEDGDTLGFLLTFSGRIQNKNITVKLNESCIKMDASACNCFRVDLENVISVIRLDGHFFFSNFVNQLSLLTERNSVLLKGNGYLQGR